MLHDVIGWLATAVFITSYFAKDSGKLRLIQGGAASLWAVYGILLHATPIIVANILVAGVAVVSARRPRSGA